MNFFLDDLSPSFGFCSFSQTRSLKTRPDESYFFKDVIDFYYLYSFVYSIGL